MPNRLASLPLALAVLVVASAPGVATAQVALPTSPDDLAQILGGTPTEPGAEPSTPTAPAPAPDAAAAPQSTTPGPPPYYAPGPDAARQPVSAVARLDAPEVPMEPLRLAALSSAVVAILLIMLVALLRALGLRTPVVDPIPATGDGRAARLGERMRGTADDMRDFLRRSR